MRLNEQQIKLFTKNNGCKSILQTETRKLDKGAVNFTLDHSEIIGKIKIFKRKSDEFVYANIRKSTEEPFNKLELEYKGNTLIYQKLKNWHSWKDAIENDYRGGIHLIHVQKKAAGEPFKNLAETMDILAVKESLLEDLDGKIYLDSIPEAEPLHWARGFTNVKFLESQNNLTGRIRQNILKRIYNFKMKKSFMQYQQLRQNGTDIKNSLETLKTDKIEATTMALTKPTLDKYIKESDKIHYFD